LTVLNLEDRSIHTNTLLNNIYISVTIYFCNDFGPMSCGFMVEVCPILSGKNGVSWCLKSARARGEGGGIHQGWQCTCKRYIEALLCNRCCCCGKAISILYSECASVARVIQHSERMRRIILLALACTGSTVCLHIMS